jgi:hypothetical protein
MQNKDWQHRDVRVRVGLIVMQVTGASCTRGSWDPFAPRPDLWAQKAGHLFLTSLALVTVEVYHRSLLVYRPIDSDPVLPAAVTDDKRKGAAEPDAEAPTPSPEAKPDMAAPYSSPPPPSRENENLAKYSHKTPTRDELGEARMIGLANPGSFR